MSDSDARLRCAKLAEFLLSKKQEIAGWNLVAGFDAFVDELISVVDERTNETSWRAVPDIAAFGAQISKAAGHSSLREIVVTRTEAGGCAVNLGDGASAFGVPLHLFATLGNPPHPAFAPLLEKTASFHSWGDTPGRTLAFEFSDGKLMFSAVAPLADFTVDYLRGALEDGSYLESCKKSHVIALTDWTLYPHMTECWMLLQDSVFSRLTHRPFLFFDLVDPSSRHSSDISKMLAALSDFEKYGAVVLGVNVNEAQIVGRLLGCSTLASTDDAETTRTAAAELREKLGISQVVIHHSRFAAAAEKNSSFQVRQAHCPSPKKSTGAGDRFNAGYCLGLLANLPLEDTLLTACASSGFFVRNAKSASLEELATFLTSPDQEK